MPDPRPYRSTLREDQARATRRRIVDAARELFVEQGYGKTTIDAIAARAEVSRKTVFSSVGGKVALLKLAFDWSLAGDDEPVPIADRPETRRMMEQAEPGALIGDWVRIQSGIATRLAPLFPVLLVAADGDPEAEELRVFVERNRTAGARVFVERLDAIGGLRADLPRTRAVGIAETLMDPMPARRLVVDGPWTLEQYTQHVERMARAAFLP
jgi:AcrR family transcriptional regulator